MSISGQLNMNTKASIVGSNVTIKGTGHFLKGGRAEYWNLCSSAVVVLGTIDFDSYENTLGCTQASSSSLTIAKDGQLTIVAEVAAMISVPLFVDGSITMPKGYLSIVRPVVTGSISLQDAYSQFIIYGDATFTSTSTVSGQGQLTFSGGVVNVQSPNFNVGLFQLSKAQVTFYKQQVTFATVFVIGPSTLRNAMITITNQLNIADGSVVENSLIVHNGPNLVFTAGTLRNTDMYINKYLGSGRNEYTDNSILDGSNIYVAKGADLTIQKTQTRVQNVVYQLVNQSSIQVNGTLNLVDIDLYGDATSRIVISRVGIAQVTTQSKKVSLNVKVSVTGVFNHQKGSLVFGGPTDCWGTIKSASGTVVTFTGDFTGECNTDFYQVKFSPTVPSTIGNSIKANQMIVTGPVTVKANITAVASLSIPRGGDMSVNYVSANTLQVVDGHITAKKIVIGSTLIVDNYAVVQVDSIVPSSQAILQISSNGAILKQTNIMQTTNASVHFIAGTGTVTLESTNIYADILGFDGTDSTIIQGNFSSIQANVANVETQVKTQVDIDKFQVGTMNIKTSLVAKNFENKQLVSIGQGATLQVDAFVNSGSIILDSGASISSNSGVNLSGAMNTISAVSGSSQIVGDILVNQGATIRIAGGVNFTCVGKVVMESGTLQINANIGNKTLSTGIFTARDPSSLDRVLVSYEPVPYSWQDFTKITKEFSPFATPVNITSIQDNTNGITSTTISNGTVPVIHIAEGPCSSGCVQGTCNAQTHICECKQWYSGPRCDIMSKPPVPENVKASPKNGLIVLSWSISGQHPNISHFAVFIRNNTIQVEYTGDGPYSILFDKTVAGTVYTYGVASVNELGMSDVIYTNATAVDVPPVPVLTALETTSTTTLLRIKPSTKPTYPAITGYILYKKNNILRLKNETDVLIYFLKKGTLYSFKLAAVNAQGSSGNTSLDVYTTDLPGKPTLKGDKSFTITLEWDPPVYDGHTKILGYKLYRNGYNFINQTSDKRSYTDQSSEGLLQLSYSISAYNSVGEGEQVSLSAGKVGAIIGISVGVGVALM
jgi:hypothetical protein